MHATVRLTQTGSNRPDSEDKAPFKLRLAAVPKTEDQPQDKCDSQHRQSRSDGQLETLLSGSAPDAQDQWESGQIFSLWFEVQKSREDFISYLFLL